MVDTGDWTKTKTPEAELQQLGNLSYKSQESSGEASGGKGQNQKKKQHDGRSSNDLWRRPGSYARGFPFPQ